MDPSSNNLLTKKNIIAVLILAILILVIPVGVRLAQERQQLQSQAANEEIIFSGEGVTKDTSGNYTTITPTFKMKVTSPFGPSQ